MPPPSAGGIVLRQILAGAEYLEMYKLDWDSTPRIHMFVEALRRTYADRNELIGDPDFVKIRSSSCSTRATSQSAWQASTPSTPLLRARSRRGCS
jgi:gamma-glutamyltranspeptidase